jgi:S1-C subfamily serine protease
VFERYDIVTRIGSRVVRSPRDLVDELSRYERGEDMTIRLLRKGGTKILRVKA